MPTLPIPKRCAKPALRRRKTGRSTSDFEFRPDSYRIGFSRGDYAFLDDALGFAVLTTLAVSVSSVFFALTGAAAGNTANMVCPPLTFWPISTRISDPSGKKTSTLEPNFIKPNCSPCSTVSPSLIYHTILRASAPAICLNNTGTPALFWVTMVVRSFSVDDLGCQATRYLPGLYLK